MCKTIKQRVKFKAPPATVYDLLADSGKHTAVTGRKATISREVGGTFSASGNDVSGVNVDLVPGRRIVQAWRHRRFPEGIFSMAAVTLRASSSQSFSASGSFMEVLLQEKLRGDRVHRLALRAAQPAFRLHRAVALVDARHRQLELALQAPREILGAPRHVVRAAVDAGRPPDDQLCGLPFFYQRRNLGKTLNASQRMRRAELGLPDCDADAL